MLAFSNHCQLKLFFLCVWNIGTFYSYQLLLSIKISLLLSKVFWGFFRNEKQVQNISSRLQTYSPLRFSTGLGKFIKVMFNRIIFISLSDIFHHTLRPKFLNPPFLILTVIFSSSSSWYILACFMIDKAISGIYLLPYCQIHAIKTRLGSSFFCPMQWFLFFISLWFSLPV